MSDLINILPDSVANQIAAGEVVDRPASAVKELLENAIDAGATLIQLIVKDAGRTLVQVIDDGCGMSDGDARLCFERHATSKVRVADDLFKLHTMGFRGEALASIAAISQVELKTRRQENDLGTFVINEGCLIKSQTPEACPVGTSIAVKNLFFNVPARRNFLKKDSIELSHIEEVFRRVTLTNCDKAFVFYHNGKMLYDLRPGNLAQRICQLYGDAYRERFFPVNEDNELLSVSGYVGKPEYARKSRGEQYLFVNNRFIKHPALSSAIEKAYTDIIPDRYYPSYFINLTVDPSRIDVNIHPTKTEVKFVDEQILYSLLRAATKKAIGQFTLATQLEFNPSPDLDFSEAKKGYIPPQPTVSFNPDYNPFTPTTNTSSGGFRPSSHREPVDDVPASNRWDNFFDTSSDGQKPATIGSFVPPVAPSAGGVCMQILNHWIVTAMPSGLMVIDQHRAHERILYERLMDRQQSVSAQQLLFPANVTFSSADADMFNELLPDLQQRGFEVSPLGKNVFVVSATPADIKERQLQPLFDQLIAEYKNSMLQKFSDRDRTLCLSLARQMAVPVGQPLQQEEIQALVADLFCCKVPEISPSSERILTTLTSDQLSKLL
ncbi:MAG: DNA mismatch repair endonuclease MutL [Bacteroidales bacterium]|nr:DNA mismatch repair endonuclease MutL [Bacteroidales bacterium]